MKGVWKKVAILCVALAAALYVQDAVGHITIEDEAWATACDITQECTGVSAPVVVKSDLTFDASPFLYSALGLHQSGRPYVYVRENLDPAMEYLVLVHEMTHYINGVRGYYQDKPCLNEESAFLVADIAAVRIGREDLIQGDIWRSKYRGCEIAS